MTAGRPTVTPEIMDAVCELMADGKSLREVCKDAAFPSIWAVLRYVEKTPEAAQQYARARELQAEYWAAEIIDIADDGTNDWMESADGDGGLAYKLNGENIQRSRLRVDSRKWIASKLLPRKYGDKHVIEGPGPNGEHTVTMDVPDDVRSALDAIAGKITGGGQPG